MKQQNDKLIACELGDITGSPRQRMIPKRCKFKGCKTLLHSYHKGRYCHYHEGKAFMNGLKKTRYLSVNTFHIHG